LAGVVLHSIFTLRGHFVETIEEKAGKEEKKMSVVSLSEAYLLAWEEGGFSRGRKERLWPSLAADAPANDANGDGHIQWLRVKRCGQLPQQLWTISAIPLDKR
jgi:hypothetical protein